MYVCVCSGVRVSVCVCDVRKMKRDRDKVWGRDRERGGLCPRGKNYNRNLELQN